MTKFKSDFLRILSERGFIHQMSDETGLDDLLAKESVTAYIGYDPTASSLHVGSLIQIMMLRRLQQAGHKPVVLMGGALACATTSANCAPEKAGVPTSTTGVNITLATGTMSRSGSYPTAPRCGRRVSGLTAEKASVCPSAADRASACIPTLPPPPARCSTRTGTPNVVVS